MEFQLALGDRLRIASRAFRGLFKQPTPSDILGVYAGLFPGGPGSPPPRRVADLVKSYGDMLWVNAVVGKIANGISCVEWKVYVVRSGFVPHTRRAVAAKLRGLEITTCPLANLPEKKRTQWASTREKMKNCKWVRPEVVAQIEFAEWTPDAHLRHASFVGLREDKDPREVVREEEQ